MVYERKLGSDRCLVVLNPSGKTVSATLPEQPSVPEMVGGICRKYTYKQTKKGDVVTISPVSAAILEFK